MAAFCASARSGKSERHSPESMQASGTHASSPDPRRSHRRWPSSPRRCGQAAWPPPRRRPWRWPTARPPRAATPAWAALPRKRASNDQWQGAPVITVPGAPAASRAVARGAFRKPPAFGERARPQQVHLFARREQHRDVGTFGTRLHHTAHAFQNGRHARLVVGRKDGVANRAHDAVNHCRLDARAGLHGVHVRREHEAARRRARQVRDQVAGVRARLRGRGVEAHLGIPNRAARGRSAPPWRPRAARGFRCGQVRRTGRAGGSFPRGSFLLPVCMRACVQPPLYQRAGALRTPRAMRAQRRHAPRDAALAARRPRSRRSRHRWPAPRRNAFRPDAGCGSTRASSHRRTPR